MDPFVWSRSHAPLDFDRTHVFSLAYVYTLPDFVKNRALGGFVNGWQFSGITQVQSGGPLSFTSGGTQGRINIKGTMATAMAYNPDGSIKNSSNDISNVNVRGTASAGLARAVLICDPTSNLKPGQYVNPDCFAAPVPRGDWTVALPYIHGPAFMNHDLSTFKNFSITQDGRQKIQVRINAYNFLNHPNAFFGFTADPNLTFTYTDGKLDPNPNYGIPTDKRGKRILQFAIKYIF